LIGKEDDSRGAFGAVSPLAAKLVLNVHMVAPRRGEGSVSQAREFALPPLTVISLLVLAFVVLCVILLTANRNTLPPRTPRLSIGALGLLIVLLTFWSQSMFSTDRSSLSGGLSL
jgi:protein-S-isoprenylcysteine O-methyltransferase Ste14